jgi:hypothetical protein
VSFKPCRHTGRKLPDNHCCAAFCGDFPACLPPLPADLPAHLVELQASNDAEHDQAVAVRCNYPGLAEG